MFYCIYYNKKKLWHVNTYNVPYRTNFPADLISRGQKNRISRGFNFANLPIFKLISFIFLGVFGKKHEIKISRGFNFANLGKIRENRENLSD